MIITKVLYVARDGRLYSTGQTERGGWRLEYVIGEKVLPLPPSRGLFAFRRPEDAKEWIPRFEVKVAAFDAETADEVGTIERACYTGRPDYYKDFWNGLPIPDWCYGNVPAGTVLCPWIRIIGRHVDYGKKANG